MENQIPEKKPSLLLFAVIGYLFALLSLLLLPIIFMPIAILLGIICILYNEVAHGLMIFFIAIILGCVGASIGGWGLGLPKFTIESLK